MSHGDLNVYSGLRVIRDVCKKADIVHGKCCHKKSLSHIVSHIPGVKTSRGQTSSSSSSCHIVTLIIVSLIPGEETSRGQT